jgi:hypothetical protein
MTESKNPQYDIDKEAAAKSRAEAEEKLSKGKPTPTQEENDRAMMGEHIMEHEDDGSGEDPNPTAQARHNKQVEGLGKGEYKTREMKSEHRLTHTTPHTTAAPKKE